MNFGICVSKNEKEVRDHYARNHPGMLFTIENITNSYDFPVLEVQINKQIKDIVN
jgi:hypothetical protein